jgi:hypothetical protein
MGGQDMPQSNIRRWTADDIAKLKTLAQKLPPAEIAAKLGRSPSALAVKAHELKLSLRTKPQEPGETLSGGDPGPAGFDLR